MSGMFKVTWRNLVARKLRLFLSAFAIVLGVAFVAGSFIFTDALSGSFSGIIRGTTSDVEIAPKGANDFDSVQDSRTIPVDVVDEINALPEVDQANGVLTVQGVYIIGADDKLVGGNGPPGFAINYTETRSLTGDQILTLVDGELPSGPGEVAFDESAADKAGYEIGDTVTLTSPGDPPSIEATLVGTVRFGSEGGLVGATLSVFDAQEMQDTWFDGRDVYSGISVNVAEGVSQEEAADAIRPILPPGIVATTGDQYAESNENEIAEALSFINIFLLVFAFVAVVVSTFLIVNTFSILVAQRSRELALLRAMGASRRQVRRSVLLEAFVVGLVGSTAGLLVGYLLALGIRELFASFGLDLTGADFVIEPRTVVVSYAVGLLVTMFAAYLPARRAAKIAPVAAMRDEVALPEATVRRRFLFGVGLVALGVLSIIGGFIGEGESGLSLIGLGALLILVGVSLMSPVLGGPIIHGLGKVYRRLFGTVGTLASENSLRNPRRTAATASALMVGLTLVALMSILGSSASASTERAIESALTSELVVSDAIGTPFSPAIAEQIRQIDGVETVAEFRQASADIGDNSVFVGAVDPQQLGDVLNVQLMFGQDLAPGTILIDANVAEDNGYEVGEQLDVTFQNGEPQQLEVAGTFLANSLPAQYIVTLDTLAAGGPAPRDSLVFITTTPSADIEQVRSEIETVLEDNPTVTLKDPQEFVDEQLELINQFLGIIYALLGLAIVIAVLGIINTLALSVIERTREIGLLRAVGLSRRQLRRMVRLESVAIALLGAILGIVMGLAFGIALQRAIADEGLDVLSIPWLTLIIFVVLAAIVGVLAAVLPARRAAKLNVLDAITTE
jgi:putative ABC transport system permease protein